MLSITQSEEVVPLRVHSKGLENNGILFHKYSLTNTHSLTHTHTHIHTLSSSFSFFPFHAPHSSGSASWYLAYSSLFLLNSSSNIDCGRESLYTYSVKFTPSVATHRATMTKAGMRICSGMRTKARWRKPWEREESGGAYAIHTFTHTHIHSYAFTHTTTTVSLFAFFSFVYTFLC